MMLLWLTLPCDDRGIEEIETTHGPVKGRCGMDTFSYLSMGGLCTSVGWYVEGHTYHRSREDAVRVARAHRHRRIQETAEQLARLTALPEIT